MDAITCTDVDKSWSFSLPLLVNPQSEDIKIEMANKGKSRSFFSFDSSKKKVSIAYAALDQLLGSQVCQENEANFELTFLLTG